MRRPSGPTLAALVCSALVALLYVSPVLPDVARTGLDWPIWIDHPEGLIHTNYGKWWALPPHHYLVDGSSGEFPIYYPCLSDSLVNVAAAALGVPAMSAAGGAVRPAPGRGVPAAELPLARGRARRPSRGARREPADLARRQLLLPGSPRAGVGAVASGSAPRPVPGHLARHGPEPRLGADAAVPEPHASRLPRRQPGAGGRVRRAPRGALLLAHAHVRERRRCPARLPDLLQRPGASARRAFPCLARGARPRRARVRRTRGDAAVALLRGLRGARRARTPADLPRRSPQALLPLELRDGGPAGAALRAPRSDATRARSRWCRTRGTRCR